jgi:membrane protease YdiL (CAAX protease family)
MIDAPDPAMATRQLAVVAVVLSFYALFYRRVVARWGRFVEPVVAMLGLRRRHPAREVDDFGKLFAATVAQAGFALALGVIAGVDLGSVLGSLSASAIVGGALLGIAELAFASWLGVVVVRTAGVLSGSSDMDLLAESRGGWMHQFASAARVAPAAVALVCVTAYVLAEEVIFRGIVVDVFRSLGDLAALVVSVALFVGVQAFSMPSARAALLPMTGATVIGVVHGLVVLAFPGVLPLAIAHATFLVGVLINARAFERRAWTT